MRKVEREARKESMMCAGKSIGAGQMKNTNHDSKTVYRTTKPVSVDFKTPPPFVRCNCTYGRHSQFVKSAPGSALDGAEYEITKPCGVCAGSPLPGWIPQYYTPEQYSDWIRRENGLPEYELPDALPVWFTNRVSGDGWFVGSFCEWEFCNFDTCVIRNEAGRPPQDHKPQ